MSFSVRYDSGQSHVVDIAGKSETEINRCVTDVLGLARNTKFYLKNALTMHDVVGIDNTLVGLHDVVIVDADIAVIMSDIQVRCSSKSSRAPPRPTAWPGILFCNTTDVHTSIAVPCNAECHSTGGRYPQDRRIPSSDQVTTLAGYTVSIRYECGPAGLVLDFNQLVCQ